MQKLWKNRRLAAFLSRINAVSVAHSSVKTCRKSAALLCYLAVGSSCMIPKTFPSVSAQYAMLAYSVDGCLLLNDLSARFHDFLEKLVDRRNTHRIVDSSFAHSLHDSVVDVWFLVLACGHKSVISWAFLTF